MSLADCVLVTWFVIIILTHIPKKLSIPSYILIWSLISVGIEFIATRSGVFHYRHGYKLYYSFPIYLLVQSCWLVLYHRYRGVHSS